MPTPEKTAEDKLKYPKTKISEETGENYLVVRNYY